MLTTSAALTLGSCEALVMHADVKVRDFSATCFEPAQHHLNDILQFWPDFVRDLRAMNSFSNLGHEGSSDPAAVSSIDTFGTPTSRPALCELNDIPRQY